MRALSVDPGSAAFVKSLLASTPAGWVSASVPVAQRKGLASDIQLHGTSLDGLDKDFWVPAGAEPGLSNDHHLTTEDLVTGRTHDLHAVKVDAGGRIIQGSWDGGRSYDTAPVVAHVDQLVKAGANTGTNASNVPCSPSALRPSDVVAGIAARTLRFVFNKPGPGAPRYPAGSYVKPYPGLVSNPPLGVMLRLKQTAVLPAAAGLLERCIFNSLRDGKGAVGTDGGSNLAFKAWDGEGGGQSAQSWAAVGVTLNAATGGVLSSKGAPSPQLTLIPWDQLEVVVPPSP